MQRHESSRCSAASDQSGKIVYVVGPDNKVKAKPVMLGPIDDSFPVITTGLSSDDRLIEPGRVSSKEEQDDG